MSFRSGFRQTRTFLGGLRRGRLADHCEAHDIAAGPGQQTDIEALSGAASAAGSFPSIAVTVNRVSCIHDGRRGACFSDVIRARDFCEALCRSGAAPNLRAQGFAVGLTPSALLSPGGADTRSIHNKCSKYKNCSAHKGSPRESNAHDEETPRVSGARIRASAFTFARLGNHTSNQCCARLRICGACRRH